jgi:hypothetical protein
MEEDTKTTVEQPKKVVRTRAKRRPRTVKPKSAVDSMVEAAEEKPAKKHDVTEPWRPVSILKAPKIPGYVTRWTDKSRMGLVEKRLDEGWEYVIDKTGNNIRRHIAKTIQDGSDIDGTIHRRELVLMKLPMDRKLARDRFIADKTMTPEKMAVKLERDMMEATGERGHSIFKIATEGG